MAELGTTVGDSAALAVSSADRVEAISDPLLPFSAPKSDGAVVSQVREFLRHVLVDNASRASLRWHACKLLAWFGFLDAARSGTSAGPG